ncbi:MAG: spore coat associated protein CotJA [Clostridia bacterium]|nr:spore coat associated protein CotJA [Clostridia bacterium]
MEHKIFSQDGFDDAFDSVQVCILNKRDENVCCDFSCVDDFPLAMAYVPMQKFINLYNIEDALCAGTLFKDLDKPFLGCRAERKKRK